MPMGVCSNTAIESAARFGSRIKRRKTKMALRPADAYAYAKFRSTLAESDCNAILSDGTVLLVLIEDQGTKLYVEIDYKFFDPATLPNFVRYELRPEERAKQEAEKAAAEAADKSKKLPGRNWLETRQAVEAQHRQGTADRYQQNQQVQLEQSNVNRTVQAFADAAKREREAVAARMRPAR
jgi:hypothetical protein